MSDFVCSKCNAEFKEAYKFCKECGGVVEEKKIENKRFCPNCGKELQPEVRFCSFCGGKAKKYSTKLFLILLAAVILLVIAGGVGYKYVKTGKTGKTGVTETARKDKGSAAVARVELEAHIDGKEFVCCKSSRNLSGRPKRISLNYAREADNTYSFYVLWVECRHHGPRANNYLVVYKGNGEYTVRLLN